MDKTNYKEVIENLCDDLLGNLDRHYSGRGMYGKTCMGIVFSGGMSAFTKTCVLSKDKNLKKLFENHQHYFDDMGKNLIVYWPTIRNND